MTDKSPTEDHRLFIDKYRPQTFANIKFNHDIAKKLVASSNSDEIAHLVIKGPQGSGKSTFADLFIKSKYSKDTLKIKQQNFEIKHASKTIELQLLYSKFHYRIDPSAHGVYDRLIIQGFIKDVLQGKPICDIPYHIIIIEHADKLTMEAQQSLRRTLEKYIDNCRFIFIINQDSTLIEPLMSRCIEFRLSAPNDDHIQTILEDICSKEQIKYLSCQLKQITHFSDRNVNTAVNLLQYIYLNTPEKLSNNETINFNDIIEVDNYLTEIMDILLEKKNPKVILQLRTKVQDLLVQCVEPIVILKKLFKRIFDHFENNSFDEKSKHYLVHILSKYENTLKLGSKPIYHIEGFLVSVLNLLAGNPPLVSI